MAARRHTIMHQRALARHTRRTFIIAAAVASATTFSSASRASFEWTEVEQSRNGWIEVTIAQPVNGSVNGTRIYKHDASYNRVDTDNYANVYLHSPAIGASDVRYYLGAGNVINKIGNDDKLATYASFTPPS